MNPADLQEQDPPIPGQPVRMMLAFYACAALSIGANITLRATEPEYAVKLLLAAAPVPALAWLVAESQRYLRSLDELQARIQLAAFATTCGVMVAFLLTYTLLRTAGIGRGEDWSMLWPLAFVTYLLANKAAAKRYG